MKYRPDIDGLRAIAVLGVLLFHFDLGCPGGFVGVDVFFVISGFLITGILSAKIAENKLRPVAFWRRRILRLMPVLTTVLFASLCAGYFILLPDDYVHSAKATGAQALFASNVYFWQNTNYFDTRAETSPVLHCWSLALEEQFYFLFPPLLFILLPKGRTQTLTRAIWGGAASSSLLSAFLVTTSPVATFYLLPTRAWEFALGALLALQSYRFHFAKASLCGWLGLLGILLPFFIYDQATPFPGIAAALPCIGTFLLIANEPSKQTALGKILTCKPLVLLGLTSYSLYIWHWPVWVYTSYLHITPLPLAERVVLAVACLGLAGLSWRYLETPFRNSNATNFAVYGIAGLTSIIILVASGWVISHKGWEQRITPEIKMILAAKQDATVLEVTPKQLKAREFHEFGEPEGPIDLVLWGDSNAMAVLPVVEALATELKLRGIAITHSVTLPLFGCDAPPQKYGYFDPDHQYFQECRRIFEGLRPKYILLAASWQSYTDAANFEEALMGTLDFFESQETRPLVMLTVPKHQTKVPRALAMQKYWNTSHRNFLDTLAAHRERNLALRRMLQHRLHASRIIDPGEAFFSEDEICTVQKLGKVFYRDSGHLTPAGAMQLKPLFEKTLRAAIEESRESSH